MKGWYNPSGFIRRRFLAADAVYSFSPSFCQQNADFRIRTTVVSQPWSASVVRSTISRHEPWRIARIILTNFILQLLTYVLIVCRPNTEFILMSFHITICSFCEAFMMLIDEKPPPSGENISIRKLDPVFRTVVFWHLSPISCRFWVDHDSAIQPLQMLLLVVKIIPLASHTLFGSVDTFSLSATIYENFALSHPLLTSITWYKD